MFFLNQLHLRVNKKTCRTKAIYQQYDIYDMADINMLATSKKKMNNKEKSEIENLLKSIPNDFRVIENKINTKVIDEYYEMARSLEDKNQNEIIQNQDKWRELEFVEEIKELLVCLSEIGDVKSYRKIEEITKSGNSEILDFSYAVS